MIEEPLPKTNGIMLFIMNLLPFWESASTGQVQATFHSKLGRALLHSSQHDLWLKLNNESVMACGRRDRATTGGFVSDSIYFIE